MPSKKNATWYDRKRTLFGLPLSFTKYCLFEDKFFITTGFLNTKEEEIRVYRIMDVTLKRSFGQRIFGLGTIHVCSADKSTPEFDIKSIKKPAEVRDLLSDLVEAERREKGIVGREFLGDEPGDMGNH